MMIDEATDVGLFLLMTSLFVGIADYGDGAWVHKAQPDMANVPKQIWAFVAPSPRTDQRNIIRVGRIKEMPPDVVSASLAGEGFRSCLSCGPRQSPAKWT